MFIYKYGSSGWTYVQQLSPDLSKFTTSSGYVVTANINFGASVSIYSPPDASNKFYVVVGQSCLGINYYYCNTFNYVILR